MTAVERRLAGDLTGPMDTATRQACVRELHGRGWTDAAIARRIGACRQTVHQDRKELGLPAVAGPWGNRRAAA